MRLLCALLLGALSFVVIGLVGCNETCPEDAARPPLSSYVLDCVVDTDCAIASVPSCAPCECSSDVPIRAADADRFVEEQTICCDTADVPAVACLCSQTFALCSDGSCSVAFCESAEFAGDSRCDP